MPAGVCLSILAGPAFFLKRNINVDNSQNVATVLSLCSGYGGLDRGIELAGVRTRVITYVEIETYAIANLVQKMETGQLAAAPIWSNLKTLPLQPYRGRVDILAGGYPCQPFSSAGKRLGQDDPRHLWPDIARIIETVRPVRCFFENVEGHITKGLRDVISDLGRLGYRTTWGIFSAAEVGAPHQRKRVFIMADTSDTDDQASQTSEQCPRRPQVKPGGGGSGGKNMADTISAGLERWAGDGHAVNRQEWQKEKQDRTVGPESVFTVADTDPRFSELANRQIQTGRHRSSSGGQAMADTDNSRGHQDQLPAKPRAAGPQQSPVNPGPADQAENGQITMWPAGPDSAQHDWEISRVIESGVGGTADGAAHRVDRLRLLGNGVVPATAAKAWMVLSERLSR